MGGLSREELCEELERFSTELRNAITAHISTCLRQELEQPGLGTAPLGQMVHSAGKHHARRSISTIRGSRNSLRTSFVTESQSNGFLPAQAWHPGDSKRADGRMSPLISDTSIPSVGAAIEDDETSKQPASCSSPPGSPGKRDSVSTIRSHIFEEASSANLSRRTSANTLPNRRTSLSMLGSSTIDDMVGANGKVSTYTMLVDRDRSFASEKSFGIPDEELTWQQFAKRMVKSPHFEQAVGVIVVLNALTIGLETEFWAQHPQQESNRIADITEAIFCWIFTTELAIRFFAFRCNFFCMDGRSWNILDMFLVTLQLTEQVLRYLEIVMPMHVGIIRLLKILRIIRVTRLIRSIHLFDDLRVIVSSVMASAPSLGWSFALLLMLIYTFSLIFLQIVLSSGELETRPLMKHWFRSLPRTIFTLFECIVGGVSWDEVISPLIQDLGGAMGLLFCVYIAVSTFALMNLLTGVFVDKAMRTVREDKDMVLAFRIRDLFLSEGNHALTWPDFQNMLTSSAMQDYFKQINVEVADAEFLFELLDADGSGEIDSTEIVEGCLKLRGPAKALDLAMLHKDVHHIMQDVDQVMQGFRIARRDNVSERSLQPIRTYPMTATISSTM